MLEVILPLDMAVAQTQADLRGTFSLMTAMTAFGLLGLALVIGTVRRYTAAAPRLAAEAARANGVTRLKTAFVTLVSHELRTPLTSVTGDVELLLEGSGGPLTEAPRESLGMLQRNAEGLVKLIDALLDISRIEAGRVVRQRTPLDLVPRIQGVASSLRPQLEATGQRLAPDGQARRFTKFFRARHGASHGVGGIGLGLAITRALVELHGGVITVTNALGQGSAFSFTLPAVH
jgi:signal transduction histidine kinase